MRRHVISSGPTGVPAVALTLDDGYNPDVRILELTEQLGIRGTAFLTGQAAAENPWLAQRLVRGGWEVCSHTWSHARLTHLSAAGVKSEITRGMRAVESASGVTCPYFRPPYGSVDETVIRVAGRLGVSVVNWNASISDSTPASTPVSRQVSIAMQDVKPGAILLGHFGNTHSYEALRQVLPKVMSRGYRIGTLTELLHPAATQPHRMLEPVGSSGLDFVPAAARPVPADKPPDGVAGLAFVVLGATLAGVSRALRRLGRERAPSDAAPFDRRLATVGR